MFGKTSCSHTANEICQMNFVSYDTHLVRRFVDEALSCDYTIGRLVPRIGYDKETCAYYNSRMYLYSLPSFKKLMNEFNVMFEMLLYDFVVQCVQGQ
jgi:hypothetical protein